MRNVLCPAYSVCLDLAARSGEAFSCDDCRRRGEARPDHERRFDLWHDLDGCRLLLLAVFFPEAWAEWNQDKIREPGGPGAAAAAGGENGEGNCIAP